MASQIISKIDLFTIHKLYKKKLYFWLEEVFVALEIVQNVRKNIYKPEENFCLTSFTYISIDIRLCWLSCD